MGPCRIDPFGVGPTKGVCGADADVIVARNLGRAIAAGSSAHSDHGRDILEVFDAVAHGEASGYEIADEAKLRRLAAELGVDVDGRDTLDVAKDVADVLFGDYGSRRGTLSTKRAPRPRRPSGRSSARPAGSTARTSRCCTAPTWASTTTT